MTQINDILKLTESVLSVRHGTRETRKPRSGDGVRLLSSWVEQVAAEVESVTGEKLEQFAPDYPIMRLFRSGNSVALAVRTILEAQESVGTKTCTCTSFRQWSEMLDEHIRKTYGVSMDDIRAQEIMSSSEWYRLFDEYRNPSDALPIIHGVLNGKVENVEHADFPALTTLLDEIDKGDDCEAQEIDFKTPDDAVGSDSVKEASLYAPRSPSLNDMMQAAISGTPASPTHSSAMDEVFIQAGDVLQDGESFVDALMSPAEGLDQSCERRIILPPCNNVADVPSSTCEYVHE